MPRRFGPRFPRRYWMPALKKAALAGVLAFVAVFLARYLNGDPIGPTVPRAVEAGIVIFAIGFVIWALMARYLPPGGSPPRRK